MDDHMFKDANGGAIGIDDRVRLTDMPGKRLGDGDGGTVRHLRDFEGIVVGLDEIGDDGHPRGENRIWVRLDSDRAVTKVHPARTTVIARKG